MYAGEFTENLPKDAVLDSVVANHNGSTVAVPMVNFVANVTGLRGPAVKLYSELAASLGYADGVAGAVYGDTDLLNGVYKKVGASGSGSWTRIGDLPGFSGDAALFADEIADVAALQQSVLDAIAGLTVGANGYIFDARTAGAVALARSLLPNGATFWMDGYPYKLKATAIGTNSCTYDFSEDGVVPAGKFVFQQHFGAGYGGADDRDKTFRAMDYAAANGIPFVSSGTSNITGNVPLPYGLTWWSFNSRFNFTLTSGQAGFQGDIGSGNVKIRGPITLWMNDVVGGSGVRTPFMWGNIFVTDQGPHGLTFDEMHFLGGHANANGLCIFGSASGVRGNLVTIPGGGMYARAVLGHWGGFFDHYFDSELGKYVHVSGAGYTQHPNDIHLKEIRALTPMTVDTTDYQSVVFWSACYDCRVDRVVGDVFGSGASFNTANIFTSAGDQSFSRASPEIRAHGSRNIYFGSVTGKTSKGGISDIGTALYTGALDSDPLPEEDYQAKIQAYYNYVDLEGSGSKIYHGYAAANGRGSTHINKGIFRKFKDAISVQNYSTNVTAGTIEAIDCAQFALGAAGSGGDQSTWPAGLEIDTFVVDGTGVLATSTTECRAFTPNKIFGMHIGTLRVKRMSVGNIVWSDVCSTGSEGDPPTIDAIIIEPTVDISGGQSVIMSTAHTNPAKGPVIGSIVAPKQFVTPISGGVARRPIGRNWEYFPFNPAAMNGHPVKTGDQIWPHQTIKSNPTGTQYPWLIVIMADHTFSTTNPPGTLYFQMTTPT